jgi:DNA-binding response OmpR family regulator
LLKELEKLLSRKTYQNSDIFLMNDLKFLPYEKLLINLNSKNKEHLTEKENKLLLYFCSNKNIELTKKDLLSSIWGVSESINTHTLETHIYRLKQKLIKLEPKSSFLLLNNNGLYSFQF